MSNELLEVRVSLTAEELRELRFAADGRSRATRPTKEHGLVATDPISRRAWEKIRRACMVASRES